MAPECFSLPNPQFVSQAQALALAVQANEALRAEKVHAVLRENAAERTPGSGTEPQNQKAPLGNELKEGPCGRHDVGLCLIFGYPPKCGFSLSCPFQKMKRDTCKEVATIRGFMSTDHLEGVLVFTTGCVLFGTPPLFGSASMGYQTETTLSFFGGVPMLRQTQIWKQTPYLLETKQTLGMCVQPLVRWIQLVKSVAASPHTRPRRCSARTPGTPSH